MSLLKTIKAQLGLSSTPANNFSLDASADNGTMKLARGNAGATTQDIMLVAADGKVTFPQNTTQAGTVYVASAKGAATSCSPSTQTTLGLDTVVFDPDSMINLTIDRIVVPVTGWYSATVGANSTATVTATSFQARVLLNGTVMRESGNGAGVSAATYPKAISTVLVYATANQYFQAAVWHNAAGSVNVLGEIDIHLVRAA